MNGLIWVMAVTCFQGGETVSGIQYGWQQDTRSGVVKYIVQLDENAVDALRSGNSIRSTIPRDVTVVDQIEIRFGNQQLPRTRIVGRKPVIPETTQDDGSAASQIPTLDADAIAQRVREVTPVAFSSPDQLLASQTQSPNQSRQIPAFPNRSQTTQAAIEQERLRQERIRNQQLADQRLADQRLADQRIAEQRLAEQRQKDELARRQQSVNTSPSLIGSNETQAKQPDPNAGKGQFTFPLGQNQVRATNSTTNPANSSFSSQQESNPNLRSRLTEIRSGTNQSDSWQGSMNGTEAERQQQQARQSRQSTLDPRLTFEKSQNERQKQLTGNTGTSAFNPNARTTSEISNIGIGNRSQVPDTYRQQQTFPTQGAQQNEQDARQQTNNRWSVRGGVPYDQWNFNYENREQNLDPAAQVNQDNQNASTQFDRRQNTPRTGYPYTPPVDTRDPRTVDPRNYPAPQFNDPYQADPRYFADPRFQAQRYPVDPRYLTQARDPRFAANIDFSAYGQNTDKEKFLLELLMLAQKQGNTNLSQGNQPQTQLTSYTEPVQQKPVETKEPEIDKEAIAQQEKLAKQRESQMFSLMLFLFLSIGANFFLFWQMMGYYHRYRNLAEEIRESFLNSSSTS